MGFYEVFKNKVRKLREGESMEILDSFEGIEKGMLLQVRPDITEGKSFGVYVNEFMKEFANKFVTVSEEPSQGRTTIKIEEDGGAFVWSSGLFLAPSQRPKEPSEKVTIEF